MRKHGGTPSRRDKHVTLAAISPPGVARGRFVGGQQSGLAGSKPPPLFTREASSCSSQGRRQGEPWGASPRPSAPTYLPRGLPLSGDGIAMDAKEFFARQEQTARDIRQQLEKEHAERQKSAPSSTAQKFRVGDPVWSIRPRPMGTRRTKTWFTPGEVVRRISEDTYRIKVGHGQFRERHQSQLRVREPDLRGQHVSLSYAAHEADSDDDYAEQDDYTVEKILAQRPKASAPGGLEFKVRWRGYGPSHHTWEPVSSFVPRVNTPFMEYIRRHKTKIHVFSELAALTRAIAARGA